MPSRYSALTREQLAVVVPELLLIGHLIDRAGMAYVLAEWGEYEMAQVAIEEWAAASPIYARRMQRALNFEGNDVPTIFKGLQLDIGAPPQFMDFRYTLTDRWHGGFHLDHCGALLDVEPMGESTVRYMCHDIEDPTFDATAYATNPKARMRPIHRPPRNPVDRHPHCAWTVEIDDSLPDAQPIPALAVNATSHAATLPLDDIDPTEPGQGDYSGGLVSDLDFHGFSHSALVRIADEVALQCHLLNLAFRLAVRARAADDVFERVTRNQFIGIAGLAAERLGRALGLSGTPEDAALLVSLHPAMNPQSYVDLAHVGPVVTVAESVAHEDGAWVSLIDPTHPEALQAIVRGLNPYLDVELTGTNADWTARVVETDTAATEAEAVQITKLSRGANFEFQTRKSLPLFLR